MKIQIELNVEKKENSMFLHEQLAKGENDKITFRVIDTGGLMIVEESKVDSPNRWTHYIIKKEELIKKLIEATLNIELGKIVRW